MVTCLVIRMVLASFAASRVFLPRAIKSSSSSMVLSSIATVKLKSSILLSSLCMSTLCLAHSMRKLVSRSMFFMERAEPFGNAGEDDAVEDEGEGHVEDDVDGLCVVNGEDEDDGCCRYAFWCGEGHEDGFFDGVFWPAGYPDGAEADEDEDEEEDSAGHEEFFGEGEFDDDAGEDEDEDVEGFGEDGFDAEEGDFFFDVDVAEEQAEGGDG